MGQVQIRVSEQLQSELSHPAKSTGSFPLFNPGYETAQMAVPLFMLAAAVFEIFYRQRFLSDDALLLGFIQNIIFLNSVHVVFTYFAIFANRNGHAWLKAVSSTGFKLRCFIIFAFFCGFEYFYREIAPLHRGATSVVEFVLIFAGRHHEISQSRGIGLLYDSKYCSEVYEQHPLYRFVRIALSIFGISSAAFSFLTLNTYQPNSVIYNYEARTFVSPMLTWLWAGTFLISCLCLLFLFASSHVLYSAGYRKKKLLFNLRFPIKLMSYNSSIAAFFASASHGIEYLAIYQKLDDRKDRTAGKYKILIALAVSLVLFTGFRYAFIFAPYLGNGTFSANVSWAMALITGLTFMHYFLDAKLFLHSEANSKELIIKPLRK